MTKEEIKMYLSNPIVFVADTMVTESKTAVDKDATKEHIADEFYITREYHAELIKAIYALTEEAAYNNKITGEQLEDYKGTLEDTLLYLYENYFEIAIEELHERGMSGVKSARRCCSRILKLDALVDIKYNRK